MSETAFAYAEERQALSWESNLSIRFKQDMKARTELFDTLPLPGVGWPKAGRKQGHSCTQASQIKKPTGTSNTSEGLWEHSSWLTPSLLT